MDEFEIEGDFITITQLLKALDYIASGGEAKSFLLSNDVLLNEIPVIERKRKIHVGDIVSVNKKRIYLI